ncbi:MAG: helix-turn-helix domain-containing protein [Opitutus sp.]
MPVANEKKIVRKAPPHRVGSILESIIGCKWSLTVYDLIDQGINRPGAVERSVEGLSAKVLGDCLRRNVELGILTRRAYPEIPPRVEYVFTPFGRKFTRVLAAVRELEAELERDGLP